jgi:hypothetical protein
MNIYLSRTIIWSKILSASSVTIPDHPDPTPSAGNRQRTAHRDAARRLLWLLLPTSNAAVVLAQNFLPHLCKFGFNFRSLPALLIFAKRLQVLFKLSIFVQISLKTSLHVGFCCKYVRRTKSR